MTFWTVPLSVDEHKPVRCKLQPLCMSAASWLPILFSQQAPLKDNPHINRLNCTFHLRCVFTLQFNLYSGSLGLRPATTMTTFFCHPQLPSFCHDLIMWIRHSLACLIPVRTHSCERDTWDLLWLLNWLSGYLWQQLKGHKFLHTGCHHREAHWSPLNNAQTHKDYS